MVTVARGKARKAQKGRGVDGRVSVWRGWFLWLAAILALTFAVYWPSLDNGFTNWDDNYYVTENRLLPHPNFHDIVTTPLAGNYHPLTIASLALNYRLSGWNPASYHWFSLLLHVANTALVFLFIRMLSGRRLWTTVLTALFFGIHPMHVESVAWIAERKDVLYAFFYLLALIAYLRYLDARRPLWLAATLISFILSVASKPAAVVLPLTLLLLDAFRRRPWKTSVLVEKVPFFAVSVAAGLLTLHAQHSVGAVAPAHQWGLFHKVLFASYGTVMYFAKLVLPVRLSAIYPYPTSVGQPLGSQYYVAGVVVGILLPVVIYLFRRSRIILFGLGFFFVNIALVLQFFSVGQAVMADRYTYLPYVGLFFSLAWWLDERPGSAAVTRIVKPVLGAIVLLLVPLSLVQTWRRCDVWESSEKLWNDTIQKYPGQIVDAYNNRGYFYLETGRFDAALADFDRAIALNPRIARVWINKGDVLAERNSNDSALACFERAVALKPDSPEALNNRGGIRFRKGDVAGAQADFSRAIEVDPKFRDAYANRAVAYLSAKEYERSIADSRRAIDLDPKNPANYLQHASIGSALFRLGRPREAIVELDEAIRSAPVGGPRAGYYLRRSQAWCALGDRGRALEDAREALRLGARVDPAYLREIGG